MNNFCKKCLISNRYDLICSVSVHAQYESTYHTILSSKKRTMFRSMFEKIKKAERHAQTYISS